MRNLEEVLQEVSVTTKLLGWGFDYDGMYRDGFQA